MLISHPLHLLFTQGESSEPSAQKNQVPRKHGMQILGKVPSARRPPANLPSLKAETNSSSTTSSSIITSGNTGSSGGSSNNSSSSSSATPLSNNNSNNSSSSGNNNNLLEGKQRRFFSSSPKQSFHSHMCLFVVYRQQRRCRSGQRVDGDCECEQQQQQQQQQ